MNSYNIKVKLQEDISGHVLKKCDYVFVYDLYTKFINYIPDIIVNNYIIYDYTRKNIKFYILNNVIIAEILDKIYVD